MKIGISGSTGFVGSHVVRHFAKLGHTVIAYGRRPPPPELQKYAHYIQWDINKSIEKPFNGDVFIHAAGYVDFWGEYKDMHQTNVEATKRVMKMASSAKHFVYVSTASVYDSWMDKREVSEDMTYPSHYANDYARTKAETEKAVIANAKNFDKVTIIRPHAIYGPGDRTLIYRLLKSIRNNKAIIIGKGTNSFSITHVGNICYGLSLILTKQSPDLRIYNLVDPEPVQVKTIYDSLFSTLGINAKIVHIPPGVALSLGYILEHVYKYLRIKQSPLLTADIARQFTQESTLSTALITKELGYHPHLTYTEGFRDLHQWINSIGGLQTYLSKPVDSWSGNLITY